MLSQVLSILLSLFFYLPSSSGDSFIYGGCSQLRFNSGSPYDSNINSVLTSLVNAASVSNFNNLKVSPPGSVQSDVVYGLFQCRGDLSSSDCRDCVAQSVSQLRTICPGSTGGAIQLVGCFVKYDNVSFLGVEDKTQVLKRCGSPTGYNNPDVLNRRDAALTYLTVENAQYFRMGGSGSVQGVAQCVQDLSVSECQDCLLEAGGRLRSECETSAWGDMFLGKCYVRYSDSGSQSHPRSHDDHEDADKTLALTIGVIAGVILLIVFLSSLSKLCNKKGGK